MHRQSTLMKRSLGTRLPRLERASRGRYGQIGCVLQLTDLVVERAVVLAATAEVTVGIYQLLALDPVLRATAILQSTVAVHRL